MHKLYNWMPYGEIECSNLARGVSLANLVALCTNSMPIGEFGCPMVIMNAEWRFWPHYGEFVCRLANVVALKRLWMPIGHFGGTIANLNADWWFWLPYPRNWMTYLYFLMHYVRNWMTYLYFCMHYKVRNWTGKPIIFLVFFFSMLRNAHKKPSNPRFLRWHHLSITA